MLNALFEIGPAATIAALACGAFGYWSGRWVVARSVRHSAMAQRHLRRLGELSLEFQQWTESLGHELARHESELVRLRNSVDRDASEQDATARETHAQGSPTSLATELLRRTQEFAAQVGEFQTRISRYRQHVLSPVEEDIDPLTGVGNRRAMEFSVNSLFALQQRYKSKFSVALFELDDFRRLTESQGPQSGDHALRLIAQQLVVEAREHDVVARTGVEEFAVVMPHTDLESACIVAERVRRHVEESLSLTVSAGVTEATDCEGLDNLLQRADAAVYRARNAGRNCVFRHEGERIEAVKATSAAKIA